MAGTSSEPTDDMSQPVRLDCEPPIARLVLDRPRQGHAWLRSMWKECAALVRSLEKRSDVRVVLVESTGDTIFSGGADLNELNSILNDRDELQMMLGGIEAALRALETAPQVTIASVSGAAIGAGLEIAVACDVRVSSTKARFGIPAAELGLVVTRPDVARLVRVGGPALAYDLLLCARVLTAEEALARGLVSSVVSPEMLGDHANQLADRVARLSPASVQAMKRHLLDVVPSAPEIEERIGDSLDGFQMEFADRLTARRSGERDARLPRTP